MDSGPQRAERLETWRESLPAGRMMRVLVCGGRDYADWQLLSLTLDQLDAEFGIDVVIHGGAPGVDTLAGKWAEARGKACRVEYADWHRDGKAAGPIRNQKMLDDHAPDLVVAFAGGRGTADMVRRAKKKGICVLEYMQIHGKDVKHAT